MNSLFHDILIFGKNSDSLPSSWTKVLEALDQQLLRSQEILQAWEVYSQLAGSASERLQALQRDVTSELKVGPGQEASVEQTTAETHNVQVRLPSFPSEWSNKPFRTAP